jgi:hypothetical protein
VKKLMNTLWLSLVSGPSGFDVIAVRPWSEKGMCFDEFPRGVRRETIDLASASCYPRIAPQVPLTRLFSFSNQIQWP